MMTSCMAMSRVGHLDQLFHIFAFLKNKHNSEMVFDPSPIDIDEAIFEPQDWTHTLYGECKEDMPLNAQMPRGEGFKIKSYVDSDHAGDSMT